MDNVKIYMDCCCLNRPYDDQTSDKIRIESDVIMAILFQCFYGSWKLIGSDVIEYEIMKTPDSYRKSKVLDLYNIKKETIEINEGITKRANEIQKYGIKPIDSLHFASAEHGHVDVLLTVDKNFINNSQRINSSLHAVNPISWFMEETEND